MISYLKMKLRIAKNRYTTKLFVHSPEKSTFEIEAEGILLNEKVHRLIIRSVFQNRYFTINLVYFTKRISHGFSFHFVLNYYGT